MERSTNRNARFSLVAAVLGASVLSPPEASAQPGVPPNPFDPGPGVPANPFDLGPSVPANPFDLGPGVPANPFDEPTATRGAALAPQDARSVPRAAARPPADECTRLRAPLGLQAGELGIDASFVGAPPASVQPTGVRAPLPPASALRLTPPRPGQARHEVRCLGITRSGAGLPDAREGRPDRRSAPPAAGRGAPAEARWLVAFLVALSEGETISLRSAPPPARERPRGHAFGDDLAPVEVEVDAGLDFGDDDGMIPVGAWP